MAKESHLRHQYGIGQDDVEVLLILQDRACAICKRAVQNWTVDHDHAAEARWELKIRGILCTTCNSLLGMAKDDPEILKNAIEYLRISNSRPASWPFVLFKLKSIV